MYIEYARPYMCLCLCMHVCIHVHIHWMCVSTHMSVYVHARLCMCTCAYTLYVYCKLHLLYNSQHVHKCACTPCVCVVFHTEGRVPWDFHNNNIFNPWCACTRVTVFGVCVCVCVCVYSGFWHHPPPPPPPTPTKQKKSCMKPWEWFYKTYSTTLNPPKL